MSSENVSPKLVVGYDGSAGARAAVDYAALRAGPDGTVYVVHGYSPPAEWLGRPNFQQVMNDHLERARAVMDALVMDDDPLLQTNFETELLAEHPADAILEVAKTRGADEIVVGSRGQRALRAAILGSVSQEVLHRADVPVVVIPAAAGAA